MTKITIITQNFSSPDEFNDAPLMLLPQAPPPSTVSDRDQDGFSQLLLHDRHRQRQSYVQSYTAFETLKKRQDFVLRQESLRSLQSFIERMATKQDQSIDQSFHSYRQCFGKFINVKSSTHRNLQDQQKRPKTAGPSFDQVPSRQVLHTPATPFDPPSLGSFHRYEKNPRPVSSNKYRSNASSHRAVKSRQDTWRSQSFISHSQPFFSFTENYFHRYGDGVPISSSTVKYSNSAKPSSKPTTTTIHVGPLTKKSPIPTQNYDNSSLNNLKKLIDNNPDQSSDALKINTDDEDNNEKPPLMEDHTDDEVSDKSPIATNVDIFRSPTKKQITKSNDDTVLPNHTSEIVNNKADRPLSRPPTSSTSNDVIVINRVQEEIIDDRRPDSTESKVSINQTRKVESRPKTPGTPNNRVTSVSRLTNTPTSTPRMNYNDAVRDGLVINKVDDSPYLDKGERRSSQQSTTRTNVSSSTAPPKRPKTVKKKHTIVVAVPMGTKTELASTVIDDNEPLEDAITVQNYASNIIEPTVPSKIKRRKTNTNTTSVQPRKTPSTTRRPSIKLKDDNREPTDNIDTQMKTIVAHEEKKPIVDEKKDVIVVPATVTNTIPVPPEQKIIPQADLIEVDHKPIKKGAFDSTGSVNDRINFELKTLGSHRNVKKKTRFQLEQDNKKNQHEKVIETEPETLELLEKIRHSETGISIGRMSISKQGCRFELPSDLSKLENVTPLEYISKYCRLSPHRNYQFKRVFEKYRNNKYRLDVNNLYSAITDIHTDEFSRSQYDTVCGLIDLGQQEYQFTFDAFAGILAVCERIVYDALNSSSDIEDYELAKDPLEKCDFDSLRRKLEGFAISETMRKLLNTL